MDFISNIFSWWGSSTWGVSWTIFKNGSFVGSDDYGNKYYEQITGIGPHGMPRRWVTYKDNAEAYKVPAEWHGWLHHTFREPPTRENYNYKPWQKKHVMNMTGTTSAYRPSGSILTSSGYKSKASNYKPWRPE